MKTFRAPAWLLVAALVVLGPGSAAGAELQTGEWQLTFSPINKALDNNDNFSKDGRFLVYDTRETLGSGIGNSTSIMKVSVTTGLENFVYAPVDVILGSNAAPGLGAASFSPVADEAIFIHGPLVKEVGARGYYGTTNRLGGIAKADGDGEIRFADCRDVTNATTTPGAHRGGTHRHEYSADGKRIGFTYDDYLYTQNARTIGVMIPHAKAPCGVSHWTALLVAVTPAATAKAGDIIRAADDSWIGASGLMRGFIGQVKQEDGTTMSSLFVADIPADIDITTSDSGTLTTPMMPPKGVTIRRLTNTTAAGIVRGSLDGTRIGYYATASDGTRQVFLINSQGSDKDANPEMRPVQATTLEKGASGGLRWHPSGNSIAVISDNGIAAICVQPGPLFGKATWLTSHGPSVIAADALVWSRDGRRLAFNRRVPTYDTNGNLVKDAKNNDFRQIFLVDFPDANHNGIADPIE